MYTILDNLVLSKLTQYTNSQIMLNITHTFYLPVTKDATVIRTLSLVTFFQKRFLF